MPYLLILIVFLTTACTRAYVPATAAESSVSQSENGVATPNNRDRKLLLQAAVDLSADEPDTAMARVLTLVETLGGYPVAVNNERGAFRVPAGRLDEAVARLGDFGRIRDRRLNTQDVTDRYRDLTLRLDNALRSRERYLALLDKAQTVEETLLVERELERITADIESMKGQVQRLDQAEAFALLTVNVERRAKPGPLGYVFYGLYSAVKWLFVRE